MKATTKRSGSSQPRTPAGEVSAIGSAILAILAEERMSRVDLARRLAGPGASPSRVENARRLLHKWLRGDNEPNFDSVIRLAAALDRRPEFFVSCLTRTTSAVPIAAQDVVDGDYEALEFARQVAEALSEAAEEPDIRAPLTRSEITNLFPQFHPDQFLVDGIDALRPGKYALAHKTAQLADWNVPYWYRKTEIIPGVMLTEALAQTAAISLLAVGRNRKKMVFCATINDMRFKRIVKNDELLVLESTINHRSGLESVVRADVEATVDGNVVVRGRLTLALH
jgi:3-hydroxyacyl-[acyl-carrier-protein] dehydratase